MGAARADDPYAALPVAEDVAAARRYDQLAAGYDMAHTTSEALAENRLGGLLNLIVMAVTVTLAPLIWRF